MDSTVVLPSPVPVTRRNVHSGDIVVTCFTPSSQETCGYAQAKLLLIGLFGLYILPITMVFPVTMILLLLLFFK